MIGGRNRSRASRERYLGAAFDMFERGEKMGA